MNKCCYRIIFNHQRGHLMELMALAETMIGEGQSTSGTTCGTQDAASIIATLRPMACSLLAALGMVLCLAPAAAQVIAYKAAPANQQAIVLNAGNGVPLVNIQTPSAAGVSRNTYSQFDVQQQGVILNNSRTNTQTQLGGWVQGNPWLATGSARVILNEVISANPSQLLGYLEVAGSSAQVIIANPSGITCSGCGFINAGRLTLTTGTPMVNGGSLEGYRVEGGQIRIEGAGMDARQVDYTDLIARSVEVNAGLWANTLKVSTGSNQVDAEHTQRTAITGTGAVPTYALDVAQLGGMYAGKITLVGSEAGVGVRNAGVIGASAGEVVVTADGRLTNSGQINASGNTHIDSPSGVSNSGTIYSQGSTQITTRGNIDNNGGFIAAGQDATLTASGATSQITGTARAVLAAGVAINGTLTGTGRVSAVATQQITLHGQNLATGDLVLNASTLNLVASQTNAANVTLTATTRDLDTTGATLSASGTLTANAAQRFIHDGARSNAQQLHLVMHDLSNVHGEMVQTGHGDTTMALAGDLDNTQGRIATNSQNLVLAAHTLTNTDGEITHAGTGTLAVSANTLSGLRGQLASNGKLDLNAHTVSLDHGTTQADQIALQATQLSNRNGQIEQTGTGNTLFNVAGHIDNHGGAFNSQGNTTVTAASLDNSTGQFIAAGAANLTLNISGLLNNSAGAISAANNLQLTANAVNNAQGKLNAGSLLQGSVIGAFDNRQGAVVAKNNLGLHSNGLNNSQGTIGSVLGRVAADTGSGNLNNSAGRIEAALDVSLTAFGMNNAGGLVVGQTLAVDTQTQKLNNAGGAFAADNALNVQSGTLTNDGGLLQAGDTLTIDTHGQALTNTHAGSSNGIRGQNTVNLATGHLDNSSSGFIGAGQQIRMTATDINNAAGAIVGEKTLLIDHANSLDNSGGQIQALLAIDGTFATSINNSSGLIRSGQAVTLSANQIVNTSTAGANQGIEGPMVALNALQINNSSGAIRANTALTLTSRHTINNTNGLISSADTLNILDPEASPLHNSASKTLAITNSGGTLIADALLSIDSKRLTGDGKILGQHDISVKLLDDFTHAGPSARFAADHNARLETAGTLTNRARMKAVNNLTLKAATLNNEAGGEILADTVQLIATENHTLTNRGLINGGDVLIDSVMLNNLGTGRIYGDHLALGATTLTNDAETGAAPIIGARNRLDIGATTINNRNGAFLLSAGDMSIGGGLDLNHLATGQAGTLNNISASIEALGNLSLNVGTLNNKRSVFSFQRNNLGTETAFSLRCEDPPDCDYISHITDQTTRYQDIVTQTSPTSALLAGGNATINATNLANEYSRITIGGDLNLTGSTLTNQGAELYLQTDLVRSSQLIHWGDRDHGTTITASSSSTLTGTVPALISAGGSLTGSYTGRIDNVTIRQNTAPIIPPSGTTILDLDTGDATDASARAQAANAHLDAGQATTRITQVAAIANTAGSGPAAVVRTVTPNTNIPNNSLYHVSKSLGAHYLIETDPQFAGYRTWLTSDYMLTALALNPATTQKRLGDGFYEQRLINEQVAELTGRRFLTGSANDEAQYRALMDAGVTYAKTWDLRPGIALSAAQMALLTTDIVWLVEKSITLPDGSVEKALVPQVYARLRDGDLAPSGALLAGTDIQFDVGGDLSNSGTIAGRQIVALTAENINNLAGRISGQQTLLAARTDLTNLGGSIEAEDRLVATAGHDLTVQSRTVDLGYRQNGTANTVKQTVIDRVAGLYVSGPNGTLVASAGHDLNLLAATIINAAPTVTDGTTGSTTLIAGHDLNLGTVTETSQANTASKKTRWSEASSSEAGTLIQTTGDLTLRALNDVSARAANVSSRDGALAVQAGNDLNIEAGQASYDMTYDRKSSKSGFLSSSKKVRHDEVSTTTALASTFSGNTVAVQAGNDLDIKGSNVVATGDLSLNAGRNLTMEAATETRNETHYKKTTQSGLFGTGGVGFTLGSRMNSFDQDAQVTTAAKSTVGSTDGNVLLQAGNAYRQIGSDLITPRGSIDLTAKTIDILEARESSRIVTETKTKQSGLTIAISSPIITAVQTAQQMSAAASNSKDSRMQLLAAANVGLQAKTTYDAVMTGQGTSVPQADGTIKDNQIVTGKDEAGNLTSRDATAGDKIGGINLSISIGSSKSQSKTTEESNSAVGSTLHAGGNITLTATGAGKDSDLTIQGANVVAGHDVTLKADDEIKLLAAANRSDQKSTNSNSSASVGFSYGTGGLLFNVGASGGKGQADGADVAWTNTHVDAGNTLTLESASDTTLKGAVVSGEKVIATVGGNLLAESLQDTSTYASQQKSAGFSLSVGMGKVGGSVSYSQSKVNSNFASVTEQSGIKAGDGGFQVKVKGNTDLKGAVIASTQSALDDGKNSFHTGGTLTVSDIQNQAEYSAQSTSVNVGSSVSFNGELKPGGTSAGFGKDSGSASSTTQAGISGVAGNTAVRTGDAESGIKPIFDQAKVQKEIEAQTRITQLFGQLAPKAAADFATKQASELRKQGNEEEAKKWDEGGAYRIALHTAIGGLAGGASGALGAGAVASAAPLLNELQSKIVNGLKKAGANETVAQLAGELVSSGAAVGLGAAVSGGSTAGTAMAFNVDGNNRQLHPSETQRIKDLAKGDAKRQAALTAAACAMVRCADSVPKDDPSYAYFKGLQDYGQTLTAEQSLLAQQKEWEGKSYGPLFRYDNIVDTGLDWASQNKMGTRIGGAAQAGLGIVGVLGSGSLCTSGIGCVAGAATGSVSLDYAQAGLRQAANGNSVVTQGELVLQSLGLSPQAAAITYALLGVAPAAVEASLAGLASVRNGAASSAARLSYEDISKFGATGINTTPEIMASPQAQALVREYQAAGVSSKDAAYFTDSVLKSGSNLPTLKTVSQGEELIKVVPKTATGGDPVSPYSPYFMTTNEYESLSQLSSDKIAQKLGLPAEQGVRGTQLGFDVYSITPKPGVAPNVFASTVAPVEQGAYKAIGGAQQTIVPNRSQWTAPVKIGTIVGAK